MKSEEGIKKEAEGFFREFMSAQPSDFEGSNGGRAQGAIELSMQ